LVEMAFNVLDGSLEKSFGPCLFNYFRNDLRESGNVLLARIERGASNLHQLVIKGDVRFGAAGRSEAFDYLMLVLLYDHVVLAIVATNKEVFGNAFVDGFLLLNIDLVHVPLLFTPEPEKSKGFGYKNRVENGVDSDTSKDPVLPMEPAVGFEPTTDGLQIRINGFTLLFLAFRHCSFTSVVKSLGRAFCSPGASATTTGICRPGIKPGGKNLPSL